MIKIRMCVHFSENALEYLVGVEMKWHIKCNLIIEQRHGKNSAENVLTKQVCANCEDPNNSEDGLWEIWHLIYGPIAFHFAMQKVNGYNA